MSKKSNLEVAIENLDSDKKFWKSYKNIVDSDYKALFDYLLKPNSFIIYFTEGRWGQHLGIVYFNPLRNSIIFTHSGASVSMKGNKNQSK